MNLYLIIFTAGTYKVEQVYEKHKDLFVELENISPFTLSIIQTLKAFPAMNTKWHS